MFDHPATSSTALCALALCCCVAAGCAGVKHKQTEEAVPAAAPVVATTVPPPVVEPAPPAQRAAPAPRVVVPKAPAAATKSPPAIAPTSAPAPNVVSKSTQAPVASPPAAAPLDFASLGTRLRQTKAIGMLTKLSLKNQVDDLLGRFRAYHKRQGTATLPELRRSYDMLLLKVLSLLQDSDPPLARDIVQSRAAIWGILADPRKFTESNLMAGAAT
jgi:hypothetical protein